MRALGRIRNFRLVAAICGLCFLAQLADVFVSWDKRLGDMRMALSQNPSNGQIVFVAVDARSLSEIGAWPWSRSVHARLLDALVGGGAIDVLFDFDFTFPGDSEGDRAFEAALRRAGGATYLAVFQQNASVTDPAELQINYPLPAFADQSWPALVNVVTDTSGFVRQYPSGTRLGDTFVPSAGALLANRLGGSPDPFEIDFSIRPDTIRSLSAADVLNGDALPETFAGRAVIIGASAIELSDQLATPVHGIVPGPLIHALAAETLLRGTAPLWLRSEWVVLCLVAALTALQAVFKRSPWSGLTLTAATLAAVELAALAVFRMEAVQVPTALLSTGLMTFAFCRTGLALSTSRLQVVRLNSEARNTLTMLERVFDDSSDGIVILNEGGTVLRQSASAAAMFGQDDTGSLKLPKAVLQEALQDAEPGARDQPKRTVAVYDGMVRRLLEYQFTHSFVEFPDRRTKRTARQRIATFVFRDITRLTEQEQDIAYLSNYDERTGALRRSAFLAFLGLRLEQGTETAVFVLTLQRFKTINVTLGREVGDALLRELVARIEMLAMNLSAVARLGGTSFAFYTEASTTRQDAEMLAERLVNDMSRPYRLEEASAHIGVRIGYTVRGDGDAADAANALEQAEEAADMAKRTGSRIARFDVSVWEKQKRAREIERAMEGALKNGEFQLLYQPQHRVNDGELVGAEALVRWQSPKLGQVYPDEFIGIAESSGFIVELGRWLLERAARDTLTLPPSLTVAVNVSGVQIKRSDFARDVDAILSKVGLPPTRLCLELTETVFLSSTDEIVETMQDVSFSGVTWALDDFGTGFSSMEYLSKMPLDKIKLDKSFTMQLGMDATARPILHSTSVLCQGLGVKLLCEGVETQAHLDILAEEGCTEAQGYFFGRPMDLDQYALSAANRARPSGDFDA